MMPRELAVTIFGGETRTVPLKGERLTLGRAAGNDLHYPEDMELSRRHLELVRAGADWAVRDLGSKNGTFVNGVRLTAPHRLRPGDRILAGRVSLVYEPGAARLEKAVSFSAGEPEGHTVSVTLAHLLEKGLPSAPGPRAAPAGALSPVKALVRAGRELAARRPLPELFQVILDLALEAVGAQRGVVMTAENGRLEVRAARGEGFRISTAVRDRVLEGKTSVLVEDVQRDEQLRERGSIVYQGVRSLMAVPLQTDQRVIGLLYVDTPQPLRQFTAEDLSLLTVMANVAAIRLEQERLAQIEQAERVLAAEIEQAAEIQRRFLPAAPPETAGLDLAGYNAPCRTVGGDYFDFLPLPEGKVAVVIADVAGKGMPAALMMTSLHAQVHALAEGRWEPAEVLTRLNRSLKPTTPENRFVTLCYCVLDPARGELTYANAGHNPPLVARTGGEILRLEQGGPVLGILPALAFQQYGCRLEPGDVLLLYSDGVTEATSPQGEEFGEERLVEVLRRMRSAPAETIVSAVHDALEAWMGAQPPADDLTVVAARRA